MSNYVGICVFISKYRTIKEDKGKPYRKRRVAKLRVYGRSLGLPSCHGKKGNRFLDALFVVCKCVDNGNGQYQIGWVAPLMPTRDARVGLPQSVYVRMFIIVFVLELVVEGFGYQVVGRWVAGHIWESNTAWERVVHVVWMLLISTPILFSWIIRQLRRQRQYLNSLHDKENEFLSLFLHNSDSIIALDANGQIVNMNYATEQMLGYSSEEIKHMDRQTATTLIGQEKSHTFLEKALQGEAQEYENTLVCRDGRIIHVIENAIPIYQGDVVTGIYIIAKDITEQREVEQRIWSLAHHDHLTELPNRRLFSDQLDRALARAQEGEGKLAVLFVDLDRFKYINDALGHDVGDDVLRIVSKRMSRCVEEGGVLARFGGDEFAVLLPHIEHVNEAKELAERLLRVVQDCIAFDGYEFYLTSSIGIAMYPVSGESSADLLRNADTAMYEAKRRGKNRFQIQMPSLHKHAYERFRLENDLRRALRDNELFLEYQPQVDVTSGTVVSAEALIRWRHPVIGVMPPGEFIPLAEETGLIEQLGEYVLKEACRRIEEWRRLGKHLVPIAVNVSPVEIGNDHFVQRFRSILADMNVSPQLISIEITESTLMKNERNTLMKLQELKDLGIRILVDDFGRGYSSLGFLKQFPVDVLKVDEIFVRELDRNYEDASIVSAVITLAHSRRLKVIAEGVEREQQLAVLGQTECDEYQGYFFSPPVSAESFAQRYLRTLEALERS